MFALTISETVSVVDEITQKINTDSVYAYIWHPCAAAETFGEACEQLKTQLAVVAEIRQCETLVANVDTTLMRHQRYERDRIELMANAEDNRMWVTLKVFVPTPGDANREQYFVYVFDVREQK